MTKVKKIKLDAPDTVPRIVPSETSKPAFPPTLINRQANRIKNIFQNITIEPASFLISFSTQMDDVSLSQMTIYKTCRENYNETVCDDSNLVNNFTDVNDEVQGEVAQFGVYKTLVANVLPIFFSFYLGAWCDLFGRKLLFKVYLTSRILEQLVVVGCAYFLTSPKEYLLFANLPTAFAGGFGVYIMAVTAFLADISPPDTLAFRLGMNHLASSVGRTSAPPLGAYIFTTLSKSYGLKTGFVSVFAASLLGTVLGALFMVVRVSSFHWTPKKPENNRTTFSPMHVWDCLRTTFKPRAGPNRKYILLFMMTILFTIVPYVGEYLVDYFYVRQKFQWEVTEYSTYTAAVSSAGIIGQAIFIPVISLLGVSESLVLVFLYLTFTARFLIKAFATSTWMYYLGGLVDPLSSYSFSIIKAMSVMCVSSGELGKINAVLSALESLFPLVAVQGYTSIWKATNESFPGAAFLCSACFASLLVASSLYTLCSLRGKKLSEVTKAGAGRFTEEEMAEQKEVEDRKLSPDTFQLSRF